MTTLTGWSRVTATAKIGNGPLIVSGAIVNSTVSGSYITLYHSEDGRTGSEIVSLKTDSEGSQIFVFPEPLYLPDGLYVALGSNVTEALILWVPFKEGIL